MMQVIETGKWFKLTGKGTVDLHSGQVLTETYEIMYIPLDEAKA